MSGTRLRSETLDIGDVSAADRRAMYEIFARHYDCVTWEHFVADLEEKNAVILLRAAPGGRICGFSTQRLFRCCTAGVDVRVIFSGDTVVDRSFWGEQELGKAWCRFVSGVFYDDPDVPLYWLLISKGYRTYLYLPLFFNEFWPRVDRPTPRAVQRILDAAAGARFPSDYNSTTGLVVFPTSLGQLKPELAVIPERRRANPHVQFFLQKNPGFAGGNELVCLAEISPQNLKRFAARIIHNLAEARMHVAR